VTAAAVSPAGALAWIRSLSIDVREAVVLDASGAVLAGDPALGARAVAVLAAADALRTADTATSVVRDGELMVVRAGGHAVAATLGGLALERVARHDLAAAAQALGGT
jgi:regulator of RNase E activity RraA